MPIAPTRPTEIVAVPDAPKAPHLPADLPEQVLGPPPRPPKLGRAGGLPHGPRSRPIRIGQTAREAALQPRPQLGPTLPRLARGRDLPIQSDEERDRPVGGRPVGLAARRAAAARDRIRQHRTAESQAAAAATPGTTRRERIREFIRRRMHHEDAGTPMSPAQRAKRAQQYQGIDETLHDLRGGSGGGDSTP